MLLFETFAEAQSMLLWITFGIALIMGAVVNKTNFCTMGAVSDVVNMGDWGRMRAWLFAIAVALVGMLVLESMGLVNPGDAFPPYRQNQLVWAENIIGGLIFGIGMTLASGCGNKTLIRIGGGNLKSIVVLLIIGVIAFFMVNPFPGSDKTLFSVLFYDWIRPTAITLSSNQDLGSLVSSGSAAGARLAIGGVITAALLFFIFRSADFRSSFDNVLGGLVVGLSVLAFWYVSSSAAVDLDGDVYSLRGYVQDWSFLSDRPVSEKPDAAPLSAQSFTFINPMGQSVGYAASGFDKTALTAGLMALFGVIAGSFLWALFSKGFRIEWFASTRDFVTHVIGAIMMGFGGVLAMGCTIGQGITGVSTLALGSILTLISIVLGSALTMKISYYRMVYEDEATFGKALVTAMVDLRMLPAAMRRLDAV